MSRRATLICAVVLLLFGAACTNKKSVNPLANIGSKQPDKVLFDKAMDAMHHNRFDVARLTLQTLINTYPDSEFVARAKLAVGDSWYAEGGTAALAQAEQEYDDFETFFPNMPEAAEAQLKIANIHYQQMEKADRDFTHAKRAEDEYRKMILTYPDSKLVPEAKQRLLEVQEVLAEREFEIGRFYYLRESYPASIARLQSLVNKYPLYSRADEALYLLGQDYEGQIARLRAAPTCDAHGLPRGCGTEAGKAKYIEELAKEASKAYDQILTRYPVMDRSDDAKRRLEALKQPIPRPTKAAVAQNKAEMASRGEANPLQRAMSFVKRGPDVTQAAKVGEPSLVETEPLSVGDVIRTEAMGAMGPPAKGVLGVEVVQPTQPAANEPAPAAGTDSSMGSSPFGRPGAAATAGGSDPNELKPNVPADPNELKPTDNGTDQTLPPPPQVNEIHPGSSSNASADDGSQLASDQDISSSRKKKKKGLKKIIPF
ncbi:MAG TPA: outer membrane protein assembly factor BamD [Terriglobales bacterium]|nr:outer membrane protein assembly factor BamD [Terriglobales bacterium]